MNAEIEAGRTCYEKSKECFSIEASEGASRAGFLHTSSGVIRTPVFMPVGTQATVKGLNPQQLAEIGSQMLLVNTYHLHLRPGEQTIAELGGIHQFMGWSGPILSDSGGFQIYSLAS